MAEWTLEQGVSRMDVAVGDGTEIFSNAVGWRVDQMNIIVQTMEKQGELWSTFIGRAKQSHTMARAVRRAEAHPRCIPYA
jgi:hypothetical protein